MDAHRCIKEQTKPSGAAKITCCGVELSKDILKKFANKIEQDPKYIQNTLEEMVKQLCFDVNDCAEVRELLRQSNGNITNDKIDEIIACLASPQGITCFIILPHKAIRVAYNTHLKMFASYSQRVWMVPLHQHFI